METVLRVAPVFGRPSLLAFVCSGCGGAKSDVIYPERWRVKPAAPRQDVVLESVTLR